MKKYIAIATLLAAGGAFANAADSKTETILDVSFESASSNWASGQWNGWNTPHLNYGENGAVIAQPWKQNTLSTGFSIVSDEDVSYAINFSTYGNGNEQAVLFYLSSSAYSIVMGTSYNSNKEVAVGTVAYGVDPRTEQSETSWGNLGFQNGTAHTVSAITKSVSGDWAFQSLDYSLVITNGILTVSVSQGEEIKWESGNISINSDFSFDQIGFVLDGGVGNAGVKSISITKTSLIPEPSTFGLLAGLGALALVGARRRRR